MITGECYEMMGESKVGMGLVQKNITVAKHRARNGGEKEYYERERGGGGKAASQVLDCGRRVQSSSGGARGRRIVGESG